VGAVHSITRDTFGRGAAAIHVRYASNSDKRPRGPAVGYGPHRTIYLTGIDANGKVARASACRRFRALSWTARWGHVGSLRARVGHGYQLLRL